MNDRRADFGILNFWWCNDHGAILTAYALQQFMAKAGFSSELLKCWRDYDDEKREGGISELFERQNMKSSSKIYRTYNDIFEENNNMQLNNDYVGFITGSDQVFRPEYVPDSWYLNFVKGKGKMAVAASFGTENFICDEDRFERINQSIQEFDYISIREDSGVELCRKIFDVESVHLLDPVFMIDRAIYERVICTSNLNMKNAYIFCYIRDLNENIESMIESIKAEKKCDIVWCTETMLVEDFLYHISNCKYMITDSYHGLCFSIIFNKNYLCVRNTVRGKARFDSLQKMLELNEESFVEENAQSKSIEEIDYYRTNAKLKFLAKDGGKWLKAALDETYNKYK